MILFCFPAIKITLANIFLSAKKKSKTVISSILFLFLVYFYWIENCNMTDPISVQLPMSIQGINCTDCEKGSVIDYSFPDKKVICTTCPSNTYSLGNTFRIDGRLNEWTNASSTLGQFSNLCYIEKNNGDIVEEGCQLFKASEDKNYIYADSNGDKGASSYYAELSIGLQFVRKGKVKINLINNFINNFKLIFLLVIIIR
jgi:hypothetical protein